MSDSLKATVIVRLLTSTISANAELEPLAELPEEPPVDEAELEPPRLPALAFAPVEPEPPADEEADDDPLLEAFEVEPADTASPGVRLESDTIVPLTGASSLVLASAVCAFSTLAWAPYTDACAEAMLAGEGVMLVVVVVVACLVEDPPAPAPLLPPPVPPLVLEGRVRTVLVCGEAPVCDVLLGLPAVGRLVVGVVVTVVVDTVEVWGVVAVVCGLNGRVAETYSVVTGRLVKLAVVPVEFDAPDEVEPDPADDGEEAVPFSIAVSWSSAAVRFFSAWSKDSWAAVGSREASS